jgi:multiple sugar transport system permease protein
MIKKIVKEGLFYLGIAIILIYILFPFYWMFTTAFKTPGEYFHYPPYFLPSKLYLGNFRKILFGGEFVNSVVPNMINSAIVAFITAALVTIMSIFAAFALTRLRFKKRDDVAFFILSQRILPPVSIIIPYYIMISRFGLLDTHIALILTYILLNLPFSVWILMSYFDDIPRAIEEAAWIDGCSHLQAFKNVLLPLATPGIIVTMIFSIISCYNEFMFAFILTSTRAVTLPRALSTFITIQGTLWGEMSAAAFIGILPVIAFAMIVQKHLVRVMTLGALKG